MLHFITMCIYHYTIGLWLFVHLNAKCVHVYDALYS